MLQLLAQRLKLGFGVVVVSLEACQALQFLEYLLAHLVVCESALYHALLELLVVGIREFEVLGACHGGVGGYVVNLVVEHDVGCVHTREIEGDVGQRVGLHFDVGLDATAVAHDASGSCAELVSERVGHVLGYISVVGVLVAQSLYAASRGYVVFGCGELQLAVVWQRYVWYLHQTLAVGACAHDYGAVVVLQRSARYLAGAGCSLVDEHHDRHHGVERLYRSVVIAVGVLHLALHREQVAALRYEHVEYLQGFLYRTSAVVAQVEHQTLHALLLQVDKGTAHIFGAVLQILVVVDVADIARLHAIVG